MIKVLLVASVTALFGLTGCDQPQPITYTIPKEERSTSTPEATDVAQPATGTQNMQVLPGMEAAAQAAPGLSYTVPKAWEEFPPQSVRKANFRVSDTNGQAEITVTVFPGDVGGTLANVNRWRSQIGLEAVDTEQLGKLARPINISNHAGLLVNLQGPEQSIYGGILAFHGSTWFFKMQGAKGTVAGQADNLEAFLGSVRIEDHHH